MAQQIVFEQNKARLDGITDGFFATVLTILVLSLVVPTLTGPNLSLQLQVSLKSLIPDVITYVIAFLILAVLWIGHNNIFRFIDKIDRKMQWFSMLFLLGVGFIPFTTAILGRYPAEQSSVVLFGINLLITAFTFSALWFYPIHNRKLLRKGVSQETIRQFSKGILISPIAYTAAIALSFVSADISIAIYALVPIYYIISGLVFDTSVL
jgi:uncharacterized membrane protein